MGDHLGGRPVVGAGPRVGPDVGERSVAQQVEERPVRSGEGEQRPVELAGDAQVGGAARADGAHGVAVGAVEDGGEAGDVALDALLEHDVGQGEAGLRAGVGVEVVDLDHERAAPLDPGCVDRLVGQRSGRSGAGAAGLAGGRRGAGPGVGRRLGDGGRLGAGGAGAGGRHRQRRVDRRLVDRGHVTPGPHDADDHHRQEHGGEADAQGDPRRGGLPPPRGAAGRARLGGVGVDLGQGVDRRGRRVVGLVGVGHGGRW